jgi:beta-glucosidase
MASFNSWNGDKCHGNAYLLTDILKTEMGFEGFVVGDWNGIDQVDPSFKTAIQKSINAGVDMGMQPNNYSQFIDNLIQLVNEGNVSMERIDDAVRRILTVKFEMGLFDNCFATLELKDSVGCKTHRTLARQAVRESVVMLKNDGIVPLSKNAGKILVAGSKANDIGAMCGGWTISWQGMNGEITEGTTIYKAVRDVVGSENVVFSSSASSIPDADYAIIVVGENPYAEGYGDILSATGFDLSNEDEALVSAIKNKGIPMVVVLLSGRPLDINSPLSTSNAFIAAWLPGSEGGMGIADVLFGDYSPTGKLSHTWPKTYYDVPINITNNEGNSALFPYGYGLKYGEVSVEDYKAELNMLTVFPNPAQKEVRVTGNPESAISIYDIRGNLMIQTLSKKEPNLIDISQLKTGIYLIKSGSLTQKLIVL